MKIKIKRTGKSTLSVLLAVLMVLSTMLMGSLSTATAATVDDGEVGETMSTDTTYTVYFYNSSSLGSSWSNVYAYAWDSNGDNNEAWPGEAMSKVDGTTNIYSVSISSAATTIIFNSGKNESQTSNLTLPTSSPDWTTNDALYDYSTSTWTSYASFSEGSSSNTSYEIVGSLTDASWDLGSGYAMTESNGTYVASFTVSASTTYYFKINDKSNTTDWSKCYYTSNSTVSNNTRTALTTGNKDASEMQFTPTASGTATITFEPGDTAYVTVTYPSDGSSSSGCGYYLFGDGNWTTGVELDSNYSVTVTPTTGIDLTKGFLISSTTATSGNVSAGAGDGTGCTLVKDNSNLEISSFDDNYGYPVTLTFNKKKGTVSAVATEGGSSSTATIFYSTSTSADDYKTNATPVSPTIATDSSGNTTYTVTFDTIGDKGLPIEKEILFTYADVASTSSVWAESADGFAGGIEGYISTGNYGINNYYDNNKVDACKVYINSADVTSVTVTVTKSSNEKSIGWYVTGEYNATARLVAKDGTIRSDSDSNYVSITKDFGDTTVTWDTDYINDGVSKEDGTNREIVKMNRIAIDKGLDLTIKTTMTENAFKNYYIAGYVVNGETYALQEDAIADYNKATQTVSFTYRVPLTTKTDDVIEVTPVYFMKSDETIRFYVEDYENVKGSWGDTLACYAYYSTGETDSESFNQANGFGCYPGQPMLKISGRYFCDLPSSVTVGTTSYSVKGVTLNNYKWDEVHSTLVGTTNYQTYDYSDFGTIYTQKIAESTTETKPDIIFAFKYTSEAAGTDNFGGGTVADKASSNVPTSTSNLNNVTENLTDFYNDRVDLFHNNIETSANVTNNPWIVISNGYENCNSIGVGYYATRWAVYKPSTTTGSCEYSYVTSINSASLFYSSSDALTTADYTDEADAYDKLVTEGAKNQPVVISYEKEITRATSLDGSSANGDQEGARSDGVWYYSETDATVTAHTVVQYVPKDDDFAYSESGYSDDKYVTDYYQARGTTWNYNNPVFDYQIDGYDGTSTDYYYGMSTGLQAYFNGSDNSASENSWRKTESTLTADGTKRFVFHADATVASDFSDTSGTTYKFDGWYLYNSSSNTYTLITTSTDYWPLATGNDVYVARFSPVNTDTISVQHLLFPGSTGTGTLGLTVKVLDADDNTVWQESNDSGSVITVPSTYVSENSTYKIVITINTTPSDSSEFVSFYGINSDGSASNISAITGDGQAVTAKSGDLSSTNGTSSGYNVSSDTKTVTVTYKINDLYVSDGGSTTTSLISVLDLYSQLDLDFKVRIDYIFTTRYYGEKVYQVLSDNNTSVNDAAMIYTLSEFVNNGYIESNGSGGYKLSDECLTDYSPDESNFNQEISWNVSKAIQTYDPNTATIVATLKATQKDNLTRYAYITYYDKSGNASIAVVEAQFPTVSQNQLDYYDKKSYHFLNDDGEYYSTAESYTKDGTEYTFRYWEVYKFDEDSDDNLGALVTKVYSTDFGYAAFDNYIVKAVYTESTDNTSSDDTSSDNSSVTITPSVQELYDSRNHWNNTTTGKDDTQPDDETGRVTYGEYNEANTEYDRLYIDFALSFDIVDANGDKVILNPDNDKVNTQYQVGFVIANPDMTSDDVKDDIASSLNDNDVKYITVKTIKNSQLTNKNRVEYCLGYSSAVRSQTFNVYAFVVDKQSGSTISAENVTLSSVLSGVSYGDCISGTD